jgi:ABC-type glycerol-3-phosphate transport system substrate-binding protein
VKKTYLVLSLLLLAAALALAACGGSSGGGEEAKIEEAIEESATSSDPSKCTELQTATFNENESGQKGAAATKACEEETEAKENEAETVTVSNVKVNGESATAEVEVEGTGLNGQSVEVEVVEEGGNWKLNKFLGFTKFDASSLAEVLEKELSKQEGVSAKLAKCVSEGVSELSQSDAESMVFEKDLKPVEEIAQNCE